MNRIDRISALLIQLQSRSVVRSAEMAERFGVSVRTIYRDIRTLEEAGVPICGDAGIGYSLVEGYRLPPLMFTREEAMAFLTAEKFIEQLTDTQNILHFHRGMDKVRAVMRGVDKNYMSDLSDSISVYRSRRTPEQKHPNLLQTILKSINDHTVLHIDYINAGGDASEREIEAVGVSYSYPFWYLSAWCHLRKEYRLFRLDRIERIVPSDRPQTQLHPPLETLVGHDDVAHLTEVIIRTTAEMARRTADATYMLGLVDQRILPNGDVEQRFMCYSVDSMVRWVLSNADTTSVIAPAEVNDRIKEIIKNVRL